MADATPDSSEGLLPQPNPIESIRNLMRGSKRGVPWRRLLPPAAVSIGLHLFLLPFVLAITVTFADQLFTPPSFDATIDLDNDPGWQLELDRDYEVAGVGEVSAAGEGEPAGGSEGRAGPS